MNRPLAAHSTILALGFALAATVARAQAPAPPAIAWGSPGSGPGTFDTPVAVTAADGHVYVADFHNHRIQKFTRDGAHVLEWGSHGSGPGQFAGPASLTVDGEGNVYVADLFNNRIQKFNAAGEHLDGWGSLGSGPGQFNGPYGVAVAPDGSVFVTDLENQRVQKFTGDGDFLAAWGSRGSGRGQFSDPWGIAVDEAGRVLVADHGNHRIQAFASDGSYLYSWGSPGHGEGRFIGPVGLATAGGLVHVTDLVHSRVQEFTSDGSFVSQWAAAGSEDSHRSLVGLGVDSHLDLYVADADRHVVERLSRAARGHIEASVAGAFAMTAAWPNPSRGTTAMRFRIPEPGRLGAEIFDVRGRRVRKLADAACEPGELRVDWDGLSDDERPVPMGVYFARAQFDAAGSSYVVRRRIVVLK